MRLFAALVPPLEVTEHLSEFLEPRRDHGDLRWTNPDQFHITLAFCEPFPQARIDDLSEALEQVASGRTQPELRLAGGGALPNVVEGRVLYAAIDDPADWLSGAASGCRTAISRCGAAPDGRRFQAHLTVARTRPQELTKWVRLLDAYASPTWRAEEITLFASHLTKGARPRHEVISTHQLADPK